MKLFGQLVLNLATPAMFLIGGCYLIVHQHALFGAPLLTFAAFTATVYSAKK